MAEKYYLSREHYIVKAMANIKYPITKDKLIKEVGDKQIKVDWDKYQSFKEILEPIKKDEFKNAACFYSSLHATN